MKYLSKWVREFEEGESNILVITGLPGSGKTTLANYLGKKYGVKAIHTDGLSVGSKELNDWLVVNGYKEEDWKRVTGGKEGKKIFEKFVKEVHLPATYSLFKNGIEGRCIVEGFSIAQNFKDIESFIKCEKMSVIIIDKSFLSSIIGVMKRSRKKGKSILGVLKKGLSMIRTGIGGNFIGCINNSKSLIK